MEERIKVSVLIPVYNTCKTLGKSLASATGQTLEDIEIVCVDDGSDEQTKEELQKCAARDKRIRVIEHSENRGLLYARKTAIAAARGEYCMFLDSDDEYFPQACEKAYFAAKKTRADIVQFGTQIVTVRKVPRQRLKEAKKFLRPHRGTLRGDKVFFGCFGSGRRKFGYNVWNKIYRRELLEKALPYIPEEKCIISEDLFLNFIACASAKRYYGISVPLIKYTFGAGVSTLSDVWTLNDYINYSRQKYIFDALEKFTAAFGTAEYAAAALARERERALQDMAYSFVHFCPKHIGAQVFDRICAAFTAKEAIGAIMRADGVEMNGRIAELVRGAKILQPRRRNILRVGFFYHRIYNGGIERVLSELIPLFLEWGYETVLFVEEENALDYAVPKGCRKMLIPPSHEILPTQYARHADGLARALREADCDVLLYQATMSPWFLWDMLLAKSMGIYVAGTMHELVCLPLLRENEKGVFAARQRISQLADGVQTLVRSDAAYLRAIGCNAQFIPDPFVGEVEPVHPQGQNIVWVGRLEENQKRPSDALRIFAKVVQKCPAAHLYMVGSAESEEENRWYRKLIRKLKLEGSVTMCGFCKDPAEYYKKSTLLLMTSAYETWGMVLCEAMRRGLPVVCYEMPYLETLRNNRGCVCVEQGSIEQAAAAIVRILNHPLQRNALSEGSLQKGKELASADLRGAWEKFFQSFGRPLEAGNENLRQGLENFLEFYELGESGAVREEDISAAEQPPQPLAKKAAKYWVEHGTFALIRRAMLFVYRKLHRK